MGRPPDPNGCDNQLGAGGGVGDYHGVKMNGFLVVSVFGFVFAWAYHYEKKKTTNGKPKNPIILIPRGPPGGGGEGEEEDEEDEEEDEEEEETEVPK